MEFRVLGPLEAVDDQGRPTELGVRANARCSRASRLGRLAGLLGDADLTRRHHARALEVEQRAEAPTWSARTRAEGA